MQSIYTKSNHFITRWKFGYALILILIFLPLKSYSQCQKTEKELQEYFIGKIHEMDQIEGIWSVNINFKEYDAWNRLVNRQHLPQTKWVIFDAVANLRMCPIRSQIKDVIWISPTATRGVYLYKRTYNGSRAVAKANAILNSSGILEYSYQIPEKHLKYLAGTQYIKRSVVMEMSAVKLFPTAEDIVRNVPTTSSGTGFAITSNGVIVTNHHVVENMSKIKVKGINGDFNNTYNAKILFVDKNNDLALIQISDYKFTKIENIPYTIKTTLSNVGESIFVLGYPLRASMGDEIKLTNGIITDLSANKLLNHLNRLQSLS